MINYLSVLKSLPLWSGQKLKIGRLLGGGTNDNFLVIVGNKKYVARFQGQSQRKLLGLNRRREIHNTRVAHQLGIGPRVVAHYSSHGLLVVSYLEGRVLKPNDLRKDIRIKKIVRLLKRLHAGPAFYDKFSVVDSINNFWRTANQESKKLPSFSLEDLKKYKKCIKIIKQRRVKLVPCHADIVSINIIERRQQLKLIDWDYSAMADPLFELAFIAGWSKFSLKQEKLLLKLYFGKISPQLLSEFQVMKALFHLREAVWALVQIGNSTVPGFNYRYYLARHLAWFKKFKI